MRCARALPIPMPAASSRKVPVATPLLGGLPGKNERPHPFTSPHVGHPIHHHVAGPSSVDPDKAGRRHAQRLYTCTTSSREAADDLNHNLFPPRPGHQSLRRILVGPSLRDCWRPRSRWRWVAHTRTILRDRRR